MRSHRSIFLFAVPALLTACIEDRLAVDMQTRVLPDGSCARRIEYRLERVDTDKGGQRIPIPAAESPLRTLHRFPRGEGWSVREDLGGEVHTVVVEGTVPSPNDLEGDFFRRATPRAHPARNHVSFAMEGGLYEYAETLVDPISPLATARLLAQILLKKEDEIAGHLQAVLDDPQLRRGELKRIFHDSFALPFSRDVAQVAERPLQGPRERRAIERLIDLLSDRDRDLTEALRQRLPGRDAEVLAKALDDALEAGGKGLEKEFEAAGLPFPYDDRLAKAKFRATLTLPALIVRANTCAAGDTATWEFEGEDLQGRGFDMWARAASR